jgi:hypothetical protein
MPVPVEESSQSEENSSTGIMGASLLGYIPVCYSGKASVSPAHAAARTV